MKNIKLVQLAWFFPLNHLIHLCEELYVGKGLHVWINNIVETQLTLKDFIIINIIGFSLMTLSAIFYSMGKGSKTILLGFGTLFFVNGILHTLLSILTMSYSPGVLTGLLFSIPLGLLTFKMIIPNLSVRDRVLGILIGFLIHILATGSALSL